MNEQMWNGAVCNEPVPRGVNGRERLIAFDAQADLLQSSFFDKRVVLVMNLTGILDERRRPIAASGPGMTRLSLYAMPAKSRSTPFIAIVVRPVSCSRGRFEANL
jgi:hypothetical protein